MTDADKASLGWLIEEHRRLIWELRTHIGLGCGPSTVRHFEEQVATVRALIAEATTIRCPHCGSALTEDHFGRSEP